MHNQDNSQHNSKKLTYPVNSVGEASFLMPPEVLAYLYFLRDEAQGAVLSQVHDLANPLEGIRQVINQQGKLDVIVELLLIHSRKLTEDSEE